MSDKRMLIELIQNNGSCFEIHKSCGNCPLSYGRIGMVIDCSKGTKYRQEDIIKLFIKLYGKDELMEALL